MGACAAALGCFAPRARAQAARGNAAIRLSREIENSKLIDISADSDKLCFYFSKHVTPYTNWNDKWQDASPVGAGEDALRVVQRDSGKTLYAKRLLGPGDRGGFFAGGDRLYIETLPVMGRDSNILQRLVVDLRAAKTSSASRPCRNPACIFLIGRSKATGFWEKAAASIPPQPK